MPNGVTKLNLSVGGVGPRGMTDHRRRKERKGA
jgi:hypothetical protein